ncbi:MAG TPA: MBL fold metallo-hydrolase, partial [Spirochaetota bacterium]|nr:MBL fold metallo-hydrolase [Spirochaetota bacterium]
MEMKRTNRINHAIRCAIIPLFAGCIAYTGCFTSFGRNPDGVRLDRMRALPYFVDGQFRNMEPPPPSPGLGMAGILKMSVSDSDPRIRPASPLPSKKTGLASIPGDRNILVWFGHSSYYMQIEGVRILVDPVLSGKALLVPAFDGSDIYRAEEIPRVDYLVITHDHWDHLDYETVRAIRDRVGRVLTGLGTGSHLESWGYRPEQIVEFAWGDRRRFNGLTVTAVTSRHFSGRTLSRNTTLWTSFVVATNVRRIFIGGDSGYGAHFRMIGEEYGPFDLALLECGQYNAHWRTNHMFPEETAQASVDLRAKRLFPVHWGKFALSIHAWDEPIKRLVAECDRRERAGEEKIRLVHP